jgi:GNAT superfamily N-acetyltransferase
MRLVEKQYGDLNYDRTLYNAEKLREGIQTKKYRFWLAVFDDIDVGIVCLKEHPHFLGTYEGCTLSVLPEYRRQGIAAMLMDTMRESYKNLSASSVFYSILTNSTIEQTREYENGFIPTGLALDRFLFDRDALNVKDEALPERRHHIFMVKPLQKTFTAKLFIPPRLQDIAKSIYDSLNVKIGEIEIEITPQKNKIVEYPENAYAEVYGCEDDYNNDNFSVNTYLDMTDSRCPERFNELIRSGWYFTGLKPLQKQAEYIIMHKGDIKKSLDKTVTGAEFDDIKEKLWSMGNV